MLKLLTAMYVQNAEITCAWVWSHKSPRTALRAFQCNVQHNFAANGRHGGSSSKQN
jgi:hypothetical protein